MGVRMVCASGWVGGISTESQSRWCRFVWVFSASARRGFCCRPPPLPSIEDSAAIASKQPEAELQRSALAHHQRSMVGPQTVARFKLLKEQVLPSAGYQGDTVDGGGTWSATPEVLSAEV